MGHVDDAFAKLKSNLEITTTEQRLAATRHSNIRDHVRASWQLDDDFLTGSYRRDTKTKKLKDVDIFVVIAGRGPEAHWRNEQPHVVLDELEALLKREWPDAYRDGMAIVVPFGNDSEIMSMDVVPAFKRAAGGYFIPDPSTASWLPTNPKRHHELSTQKNADCDSNYVPFVKMIKAINRELGEPISPSFLLEVMAQDLVKTPFGRYQDEILLFLATAADRMNDVWLDPAGLGGDVNNVMTREQKHTASESLRAAQATAEHAVDLEDAGQERAAVEDWRKLFGSRMPRP